MGRFFFTLLLFLFLSASPAVAQTITRQISITATVLPSPQWIQLLQTNSTISRIDLPFTDFTIYLLKLTDGNILIKNQPVVLTTDDNFSQTGLTGPDGTAGFIIPSPISDHSPLIFISKIMGQDIPFGNHI